jgi:hypothetical protein
LSTRICRLIFSRLHRKEVLFLPIMQRIDLVPQRALQAYVRHAILLVSPLLVLLGSSLGLLLFLLLIPGPRSCPANTTKEHFVGLSLSLYLFRLSKVYAKSLIKDSSFLVVMTTSSM